MTEIEVARDGAVQTITLNRPEKLNAFTRTLHEELQAALEEARDPAVRAVVITGAGRGFSAGQDLSAFGESGDVAAMLRATYHVNVLAIRSLEKPVVAAVNGVCAGAGLSLACACDIRRRLRRRVLRPRFRRDRSDPGLRWHVLHPTLAGDGPRVRVDDLEPEIDRCRGACVGARLGGRRGGLVRGSRGGVRGRAWRQRRRARSR